MHLRWTGTVCHSLAKVIMAFASSIPYPNEWLTLKFEQFIYFFNWLFEFLKIKPLRFAPFNCQSTDNNISGLDVSTIICWISRQVSSELASSVRA